ncbi:hypothetical protein [Streptomyces sp. NPDC059142]|uniref:hypothetical protein n=1 Tax=Streptomyces sp. NPDC059142 TaxID=3346739 RepID=UPI0036CAF028
MSVYRQERRADQAAEAEQRRLDAAAAEELRAERQRAADERAARLGEQRRAERHAARAERSGQRRERAERRALALTPERVYQRGTLALVGASALASLPAQILHFVGIDPVLLPLPLALEGAAWVMAAGVAYADARMLPAWVRWLLRVLVAAFAGFAAFINYGYGLSLADHGLSAADARTVGYGLAAVTLLGPVVFEIRQWVSNLAAASLDPQERARRRHAARRRRHHRAVVKVADRLISAASYGDLSAEEAWVRAWEVVHGPTDPGMTPRLEKRAVSASARLTKSRTPARRTGLVNVVRTDASAQLPHGTATTSGDTDPVSAPSENDQVTGRTEPVREPSARDPHAPARPDPHGEPDPGRDAEFEDAELERMRQDARRTYAESVQAGRTLSARALGEAYGMSESWGRKQILAARDDETAPARLRAA